MEILREKMIKHDLKGCKLSNSLKTYYFLVECCSI